MSAIFIYLLLFLAALAICLVGGLMAPPAVRACPGCGDDIDIRARHCRRCGYRPR